MNNEETWLPVIGYEGIYEISDFGRVKTLIGRYKNVTFLKRCHPKSGYLSVTLVKNKERKAYLIQYLVVDAFIGKRLSGLLVNHKDSNRENNRLDNLELVNSRENVSHGALRINKTSKFTGVYFEKGKDRWIAEISFKGKSIKIGRFKKEEDARDAYINFLNENGLINKYLEVI
jgi:hypothetical protein